jgi:hypothetical protein
VRTQLAQVLHERHLVVDARHPLLPPLDEMPERAHTAARLEAFANRGRHVRFRFTLERTPARQARGDRR